MSVNLMVLMASRSSSLGAYDRDSLARRVPMIGWGRGNRRGCCVVIPIGCLLPALLALLLFAVAIAGLL